MNADHAQRFEIHAHGADHELTLVSDGDGFMLRHGERTTNLRGSLQDDELLLELDGHRYRGSLAKPARTSTGCSGMTAPSAFREKLPHSARELRQPRATAASPRRCTAPSSPAGGAGHGRGRRRSGHRHRGHEDGADPARAHVAGDRRKPSTRLLRETSSIAARHW
jgi:hypothetical protein